MNATTKMPKYKCHKEVHALKIDWIGPAHNDGSRDFFFVDEGYEAIQIEYPELARIKQAMQPHIESGDSGYLVVYEDGYRSWSPTEPFEDGYTRL